MENYYKILEVDKDASQEIIEKAYKTLVKRYHPDLQTGIDKINSEEKIKKINEAYDILSDKEKRQNYDNKLNNNYVSFEKYNLSNDEKSKLEKLIIRHLAVGMIALVATSFSSAFWLVLLLIYSIYNVPKYLRFTKSASRLERTNLLNQIDEVKINIENLKKNQEQLLCLLQKLDYTLADIDTEKKVMQDIIEYILSRETKESIDEQSPRKTELKLTRANLSL